MNRRAGQSGTIIEIGNQVRVRFRLDVQGSEKRQYRSVAICERFGKGRLPQPVIERKAKQIVEQAGANSEARFNEVVLGSSVTFGAQADAWLAANENRKDYATVKGAVENWLKPTLKDVPLERVHNGTVKLAVERMIAGELSPKSVRNYVQVCKAVVASFQNVETLEPIFQPKWNNKAMGCPVVEAEAQRRPSLEVEQVNALLQHSEGWFRVLVVILASTGMRISEALALETKHLKNEFRTIVVEQQVSKDGTIVADTKTTAGIREVDVHTDVAAYLRAYVTLLGREGLLFPNREGTARLFNNVDDRQLKPALIAAEIDVEKGMGFHSLRRFRATWLDEMNAKPTLRKFWSGWKPDNDMAEHYSRIRKNLSARLAESERVGCGFKVPALASVSVVGPKKSKKSKTETKGELIAA